VRDLFIDVSTAVNEYLVAHGPVLFVELFGIFISTWVGASVAFRRERRARKEDERTKQIAAGKGAQLALRLQYNFFKQLSVENLRRWENNEDRWRRLSASFFTGPPERVNAGELGFFVVSRPQVLFELSMHDYRVATAAGVLKERSELYVQFVRLGVSSGEEPHQFEANNPDLVGRLMGLTDSLYEVFDFALESTRECYRIVTDSLVALFGAANVLDPAAIGAIDSWWENRSLACGGSTTALSIPESI
jgi:hypothetical protein